MPNQYLDSIFISQKEGRDMQNDWREYMRSLNIKRGKNTIKIMVYPGILGGVGYYRVLIPFMELAFNPSYDIRMSTILSIRADIDWADIIIFDRLCNENTIIEAKRVIPKGKKIIVGLDDYMHELPSYHPQKRSLDNSRYLTHMDELCDIASLITVSTDYLKKLYQRRYKTPIEVLPNCIRATDQNPKSNRFFSKDKEIINLGWAGSTTHYEDLKILAEPIKKAMDKDKRINLITMNFDGKSQFGTGDALEGIPAERRLHIAGCDPHIMSLYTSLIDIGLAPLHTNDFNKAKSNVKYLEYGSVGIPMIASNIEAYHRNKQNSVLVSSQKEWSDAIEMLTNREIREKLGYASQVDVCKNYDIKNNIAKWDKLFKKLMSKKH